MPVKMLSRPKKTAESTSSSAAVRSAVRVKSAEYKTQTDSGKKVSELAKKIREFDAKVEANPRSLVRGRVAKTGLFKI